MVTQDVNFVVATESIEKAVELLEAEGFTSSRFEWSVNFKGSSKISLQLSTEDFYRELWIELPTDLKEQIERPPEGAN